MSSFECFLVTTEAERQGCLEVLAAVRARELNRTVDGSVIESHAFGGKVVPYDLIGCREVASGRIIGCLRATHASALADVEVTRREYRLDLADAATLDRSWVVTRLALLPEVRRTGAGVELMTRGFVHLLDRGGELSWITCEPGLFPMYKRLGFRPIGRAHSSESGGYRVPMLLVLHDEQHLARCNSPFLELLLDRPRPFPRAGLDWYGALTAREGEIDPGVSLYTPAESADPEDVLTRDLSPVARQRLLEHAIVLRCAPGERIIARNDGGRNLYLVRRGLAEVRSSTRTLAILGAGDLTGELAFILSEKRSADVVAAAPDTEVVCISLSALDRLEDANDRARVWRNLATDLARKLVRTTTLVV